MNKVMALSAAIAFATLMTGCATPKVVDVKQTGDANLSCAQIKEQIAEASEFETKARDTRKVNGTNVAAAVFFLPGLAATYLNSEEAITAAKERREHLDKLAAQKNCG